MIESQYILTYNIFNCSHQWIDITVKLSSHDSEIHFENIYVPKNLQQSPKIQKDDSDENETSTSISVLLIYPLSRSLWNQNS